MDTNASGCLNVGSRCGGKMWNLKGWCNQGLLWFSLVFTMHLALIKRWKIKIEFANLNALGFKLFVGQVLAYDTFLLYFSYLEFLSGTRFL